MTASGVTARNARSEFWAGARLGIPILISAGPFAVLFGAVAAANGFTVGEAVLMSATIYGGASQMVGLELFGQHVAPWLVVFSIFAVNFRHVLYSAAVGRRVTHWSFAQKAVGFFFLVDPQYAEAERKGEKGETVGFVWYMGMALPIYVLWVIESGLGATFGRLLPDPRVIGLDFLLPIYFLGLVLGFRKRPLWLPIVLVSAAASIVAFRTVGSPWHVSLGALAGIALAALAPVRPETAGGKL